MSLVRVFSDLGSVIVPRQGGDGGSPAFRVSEELDNIINWSKRSLRIPEGGVSFANIGNVGAGLNNLHSFSLPANSLATNNDFIKGTYGGLFTANDNNKRLVFSIDSQVILDTALQDFDLGVSTLVGWTGWVIYGRLGATTVAALAHISVEQLLVDGAGAIVAGFPSNGAFMNKFNNLPVSNLNSNAVTLLVQGEGTANSDVDQRVSIYELFQQ